MSTIHKFVIKFSYMSTLSIYFGPSEVSFLAAAAPGDLRFYKYPYYINDESFIKDLIATASKEMGINPTEYNLIGCGFPTVEAACLDLAYISTLDKLISKSSKYFTVLVNIFTLMTPVGFLSAAHTIDTDEEDMNMLFNLALYGHTIYPDNFDQMKIDHSVRFYPPEAVAPDSSKPILFTGDRFSSSIRSVNGSHLFLLDLLKMPGIYEVKIDDKNAFSTLALLSEYDPAYTNALNEYEFESLGTVVNTPGSAECLLSNEDGSSQLFDVKANDIFVIPVEAQATPRLMVKNSVLGTRDVTIKGGSKGLIIDTRIKHDLGVFNKNYFENHFKEWVCRIEETSCTYH